MKNIKWVLAGIVAWLFLSFLGLLLPLPMGLAFLFVIAPIASGYLVGETNETISIAVVSIVTSALAGAIGLATIGSVPPEQLKNVTGLGWSPNILILVWVCINGLLSFIVGYLKFRFGRQANT